MVPNAGEDVQNFALRRSRVANAVRCEKRHAQRFGKSHRRLIPSLFDGIAVSLHFDVDILFSEESGQLLNIPTRFVITLVGK